MRYDVVIVGGGSAGCVLASRLSEDPARTVLLVEAGPDYPDPESLPPELRYGNNLAAQVPFSAHLWPYVGTLVPGQREPAPVTRARVMGGGSAVNGQVFLRGFAADFEDWAAMGNDEWTYDRVLPYFVKCETDRDLWDSNHGSRGPVPVRRHERRDWLPFQEAFYRACVDQGFGECLDLNGPGAAGVGPVPMNNLAGERLSMARVYLDPARSRENLTLLPDTTATRVVFREDRAVGVEVRRDGRREMVEAGEVVLSAGAIASAHLLMLSGVGPEDRLGDAGIAVTHHLPGVGRNMREHPIFRVYAQVKDGVPMDPDAPWFQVMLLYTAPGSGAENDMQIMPTSFSTVAGGDPRVSRGVHLNCILALPQGAGELWPVSSDPRVQPHLEFQFFQEPGDRRRLRDAARLCARLLEDPACRDVVARRTDPSDDDLATDAALDGWLLRALARSTTAHMSGTCRIGPAADPMAVVDQHCRVRGLQGLRVTDASVMPQVVRANTNATVVMIAERVSDWVKAGS
ncbi:MAG: mycofactocin system GMC family oxidoreductase MftG [Dehalococcoidia bacterium]|nr:mycofactocin system GMC family oxidoreductase MftG [Dehalococcoidia bacterium]